MENNSTSQIPEDAQNQAAAPSTSASPAQSLSSAQPVQTSHTGTSKTVLSMVAVLVLAIALAGSYYAYTRKGGTNGERNTDAVGTSYSFSGVPYVRAYTMPPVEAASYTSESYEWTAVGETLDTWSSLITTHKMTAKDPSLPLSAEAYAQNVAAMNEEQGAIILETSIINTEDAIQEAGVDPKNPPYLLVYAYPSDGASLIEVNIQKILHGPEGTLHAFIYAYRLTAKTEQEITAYFESEEFGTLRTEVIKAPFPY